MQTTKVEKGTLVLEMKKVSKKFPGTYAVREIDFDVRAGEVHALMGENGAGKSTLMKMLAGSFNDYTGDIYVNGKKVLLYSPDIAKENGIAMIYQELSLAKPLSVAENVLVGQLPTKNGMVQWKETIKRAKEILAEVGLEHIDPMIEISELPQHEAQLIEIGKAMSNHPDILVMDEPTSALSRDEVVRLYSLIHKLTEQGIAVIYISHHLQEVFDVADRVTVMRDGQKIGTKNIEDTNPKDLVEMMVGQSVDTFYKKREKERGEVLFEAKNISRWGFFHEVSFEVHEGEILGLCGLAGAGRTEMAQSIIGVDPMSSGEIYMDGKKVNNKNLLSTMKAGIAYVTENRKQLGLALRLSMAENLHSASFHKLAKGLFISRHAGDEKMKELGDMLQIYPYDPERIVSNFSGGNQQKILLAKWLSIAPRMLILDEPSRGVDIGAKMLIHDVIRKMAEEGHAILLISSDLPELTGLADRVIVMKKGHLIGELSREYISEENLLLAANGEEVSACGK